MSGKQKMLDLYPLSENGGDRVTTPTGRKLDAITLDAVLKEQLTAADMAITPATLQLQAEIAAAAGRDRLARNLQRAAELAKVPQDLLISTYELLRPGRSDDSRALRRRADELRARFGAHLIADFLVEAADAYDARRLFEKRY